ncbi:OmpA family protein [Neptunicoccus cionae]|uniref:OmpA family protein n=1 Tax=Neptunicoccus cionae TaxID=2035344 RepID=UPI000C77829A|nr:OmpA family protein [Amylibacter cionae]PLS20749.1 hypothetical protein C0U40_14055 [Amylibacter cionae]
MTFLRITATGLTLFALLTPSVQAEEMTAEDILQRLQAQRSRTLGFVEASKPEGGSAEETAVTMAPVDAGEGSSAPSVNSTGLTLQASDQGSGTSGLQLSATQDQTGTQAAPSVVSGNGAEAMPTLATASATPPEKEAMTIDLTIYFDFDSALLQPKSKTQLTALCAAIKADTGEGTYQIIGHTDAKGKASYNKRLSQARADEVVRYMTTSCGIEKSRLQAVGAGEERLKTPEDPRAPENRRVEVQVLS